MPVFAMLTRLSPEILRTPQAMEDLEHQAMEHIRAACPHVEWLHSWAVLGPYDYLDIFNAPDNETAAQVSALIRTFGRSYSEIWPATEWAIQGNPAWPSSAVKPAHKVRQSGIEMEDKPMRESLRLQARLEAFEDLKVEIEPWLMEERDVSAREALANVLFHVDAEIAEQRRRLEELGRTGRT